MTSLKSGAIGKKGGRRGGSAFGLNKPKEERFFGRLWFSARGGPEGLWKGRVKREAEKLGRFGSVAGLLGEEGQVERRGQGVAKEPLVQEGGPEGFTDEGSSRPGDFRAFREEELALGIT